MLSTRFVIATLFLGVLLLFSRTKDKFKLTFTKSELFIFAMQGLCAGAFFNLLMLSGLHYTDANSAGLITSILPAIVMLINILFFKQNLTIKIIRSISLAIIGVFLINLNNKISHSALNPLLGNLLVLLALIPEGIYYALNQQFKPRIHYLLHAFILNLVNLIVLLPCGLIVAHHEWATIPIKSWLIMLLTGTASGMFFVLWQQGSKHLDGALTAIATAFMPLATVILAWLILQETIGIYKLLGMCLIIASIVSYARK